MKRLVLALLFCSYLSLSNAFCYVHDLHTEGTRCLDENGTWHEIDSTWITDCMNCSCISCCATYSKPTNFADDCVSVFNETACEYIVHKRDDPSVKCPFFGAVG